ncbi:MAG: ABC transporter substrate-binding protein [Chloroflexota bacterium]
MNNKMFWKLVTILAVTSLVLAACGGGGDAEPTGDTEIVASTGFVCPAPEPRVDVTSEELNIFVWTEYFPPEMLECFELVYGIKINRDEYSSNEEMYAKLSAGGTNYDLVQPTDYIVELMIREELIQEMDLTRLPNLKNIDTGYLDLPFDPGNKYTIPYLAGIDAIVYNADSVETPPTSWADLWKPEYADRMVFLDDSRVVIGMTLLTLGYDFNSRDRAQLEEAKAKLTELIPNVKLFDSDSPKTAIIAGDADLGIVWTGEAFLANQENPAIQFVYPTEGAVLWQDNWAIPVGASHLDAAYAWMNYIMQGEIFWLLLRDYPYTNPNLAALEFAKANHPDVYDAFMNSPITNPDPSVIANAVVIEDVGEALPIYDEIWTEVKGGE